MHETLQGPLSLGERKSEHRAGLLQEIISMGLMLCLGSKRPTTVIAETVKNLSERQPCCTVRVPFV